MSRLISVCLIFICLVSCVATDRSGTIGQLSGRTIDVEETLIEGGLDKAMSGYRAFLESSEDQTLAPEALRRLADLKIEKEYGYVGGGLQGKVAAPPESAQVPRSFAEQLPQVEEPLESETQEAFEDRAVMLDNDMDFEAAGTRDAAVDDLEKAGPLEALSLYQRLLDQYPFYERNDQVLYQMSRAYEELGRIEEAMGVMAELVREYPYSRYIDEVQFRRGEYFFAHRRLLDAEDAYTSIIRIGEESFYYPLALYKLGWTFYKQELYEEALHRFIGVLDYNISIGVDFDAVDDERERKRIDDTFRVISLGFSYLGGADAVVDYFSVNGHKKYENRIYENLGEYYFSKRRYSDAVATYGAYIERNPYHHDAPLFHRRMIEINTAGGFPSLVLAAKKSYATLYGLDAEYWNHFVPQERPEVVNYLKENLNDLAQHFHALYQQPDKKDDKEQNLQEALRWYRQILASFPEDPETPGTHYQMADLLLENKSYLAAAVEYERTAYGYEPHPKAAQAGYAAVYSYRQQLESTADADQSDLKYEIVRSSLTFSETFPQHEKADVVLGAAADDLYLMMEYRRALDAGRKLVNGFPDAASEVRRSAWLVIAHSSFEIGYFNDAETGYVEVIALTADNNPARADLFDNLAAAIFEQGEEARQARDFKAAAEIFLRIREMAPGSKLRATAEFSAANAAIQVADWTLAATVLNDFRRDFPDHELQPEITKKMAFVYHQDGKTAAAAKEYERIETESDNAEVRRGALLMAADLYEQDEETESALQVYWRYVEYFPEPVAMHVEMHHKIAEIYKDRGLQRDYLNELKIIVKRDSEAGQERTDRTRFLAGHAALVLAQEIYADFSEVALVKPFQANLKKKQTLMKEASRQFNGLVEYQLEDVTAAATYYLAEIFAHFSKALLNSERPEDLTDFELEEYELAIEEQAYPFEDRAIKVHQNNLELMYMGVFNEWIEKSLARLAGFIPARYGKTEAEAEVPDSIDSYSYVSSGIIEETGGSPASENSSAEVITPENMQQKLDAEQSGPYAKEKDALEHEQPQQAETGSGAQNTLTPEPSRQDLRDADPDIDLRVTPADSFVQEQGSDSAEEHKDELPAGDPGERSPVEDPSEDQDRHLKHDGAFFDKDGKPISIQNKNAGAE